jgi:hypothetical protein
MQLQIRLKRFCPGSKAGVHLKILIGVLILLILFACGNGLLKFFLPFLWLKEDAAFGRGKYGQAEKYLALIIWANPHDDEAYLVKGWLEWSEARDLRRKGLPFGDKLAAAARTLDRGQIYNPRGWRLYFEEGLMWEAFGDNGKSMDAYYQASLYSAPPYNRIYVLKKARLEKNGDGRSNGR